MHLSTNWRKWSWTTSVFFAALSRSYAIPRPAIDLTFFGPLAVEAGITTTATFTPFDSYNDFLIGGFIFEDVGVTAYHGAALAISNKAILQVGAQIHAVEGVPRRFAPHPDRRR